jgi:hypothetical protein
MTWICISPPPLWASKAIQLPSGDQAGWNWFVGRSVSGVIAVPSSLAVTICH